MTSRRYLQATTDETYATTDEKIAAITHHDHYHYAVRESYLLKRRKESDVRERIKAHFTRVSESSPEILFRLTQPNLFGLPIVYLIIDDTIGKKDSRKIKKLKM